MWMYGSARPVPAAYHRTAARGARRIPGAGLGWLPWGALRRRADEQAPGTPTLDAEAVLLPPVAPARDEEVRTSTRSESLVGAGAVDGQLRRVESRLLALAGGDPALEHEIRRYLADSCARFETARVRQFVPILVEREVRERLRATDRPSAEDRSA